MHKLTTIEEAAKIAERFGLRLSEHDLRENVARANGLANQPMSPAVPCSDQYASDYANSYATGLRDPREALVYWFAQIGYEAECDGRAAQQTERDYYA